MGSDNAELVQKKVAFYAARVNAWIQTRMELDKTLLTISSAGIGFLITLLVNKSVDSSTKFVVYLLGFFSFFMVIVLCIAILHRNSAYIEQTLLKEDEPDSGDRCLGVMDWLSKGFFFLGLIFTLIIGVSTGLDEFLKNKNDKGGQEMSKVNDSLNKLGNLNPKDSGRSLNHLGQLRPDKPTDNTSTTTNSGNQSGNDNKK